MAKGQEQAAPDAVLTRIGQVVMLHHAGDREEARHRLLGLWAEIGEHGDPLHRCTPGPLPGRHPGRPGGRTGLGPAGVVGGRGTHRGSFGGRSGDRTADRPEGALAARALYPSLHLNLAADYDRLGHREAARPHLRRAAARPEDPLAPDRYGEGVRAAIGRLELRLGGTGPSTDGPPERPDGRWGPRGSGRSPGPPRHACPLSGRDACSQMTASGLPGRQPPYCLPSEHTSAFSPVSRPVGRGHVGDLDARSLPAPLPLRCPGGCGPEVVVPDGRGWRGVSAAVGPPSRTPYGAGSPEAWSGVREGPIISSASRAGACTTRGSDGPSGRGAEERAAAVDGSARPGPGPSYSRSGPRPPRSPGALRWSSFDAPAPLCWVAPRARRRTSGGCPARVISGPVRRPRGRRG